MRKSSETATPKPKKVCCMCRQETKSPYILFKAGRNQVFCTTCGEEEVRRSTREMFEENPIGKTYRQITGAKRGGISDSP